MTSLLPFLLLLDEIYPYIFLHPPSDASPVVGDLKSTPEHRGVFVQWELLGKCSRVKSFHLAWTPPDAGGEVKVSDTFANITGLSPCQQYLLRVQPLEGLEALGGQESEILFTESEGIEAISINLHPCLCLHCYIYQSIYRSIYTCHSQTCTYIFLLICLLGKILRTLVQGRKIWTDLFYSNSETHNTLIHFIPFTRMLQPIDFFFLVCMPLSRYTPASQSGCDTQ